MFRCALPPLDQQITYLTWGGADACRIGCAEVARKRSRKASKPEGKNVAAERRLGAVEEGLGAVVKDVQDLRGVVSSLSAPVTRSPVTRSPGTRSPGTELQKRAAPASSEEEGNAYGGHTKLQKSRAPEEGNEYGGNTYHVVSVFASGGRPRKLTPIQLDFISAELGDDWQGDWAAAVSKVESARGVQCACVSGSADSRYTVTYFMAEFW